MGYGTYVRVGQSVKVGALFRTHIKGSEEPP